MQSPVFILLLYSSFLAIQRHHFQKIRTLDFILLKQGVFRANSGLSPTYLIIKVNFDGTNHLFCPMKLFTAPGLSLVNFKAE